MFLYSDDLFVEFVELIHEFAVGGAVVHLFEEGGVGSAEGLEHGYASTAEGYARLFHYHSVRWGQFWGHSGRVGLGEGTGNLIQRKQGSFFITLQR